VADKESHQSHHRLRKQIRSIILHQGIYVEDSLPDCQIVFLCVLFIEGSLQSEAEGN